MNKKGVLFLLLAAFIYSTMPVLIRKLGSGGIPPISQTFLRYIVAFIAASIYFKLTSKGKVKVEKKDLILLLFATVIGYGLTNLFFTFGILYTQVGNALFLFYTYAIIAPVLGFLVLKDKVNSINLVALLISLTALILLFQPNSVTTWKIGGFFAILASLAQASYLITRKKLNDYPAKFMMFANTLMGVIVVGLLSLFLENSFYSKGLINHVSQNTWFLTVLLGLFNFSAWLAMTKGFEYLKTASSSIVLLSELVFGICFAFLFFREVPTYLTILGGILILFSSVLVILKGEN